MTFNNIDKIEAKLRSIYNNLVERQVQLLSEIGAKAYETAFQEESYHNYTGNLRSSIGWGVFVNGNLTASGGFNPVSGSIGNGAAGAAKGKSVLMNAGSHYPKGVVLIFVVGMDYAVRLEAEGKPVYVNAQLEAESLVKQFMR